MTTGTSTRQDKLLAKLNSVSKKTDAPAESQQIGRLKEALSVLDQNTRHPSTILDIAPTAIVKVRNPREFPCLLTDMTKVKWPDLSTPIEVIEPALVSALDAAALPFWTQSDSETREWALTFFAGIHQLAQSINSNSQIHNILVHRESPTSTEFRLIAGERRVFAALYSRGAIVTLKARVINSLLSPLDQAKLTDQENTSVQLSAYETVLSKLAIYDELPDAEGMTIAQLQADLGMAAGPLSILRRIARSPHRKEMLEYFRASNAGWREIAAVVSSGIIPEAKPQTKSSTVEDSEMTPKSPSEKKLSPDSTPPKAVGSDLETRLKRAGGFGLKIQARTNLGVLQLLVRAAAKGDLLPAATRRALSNVDLGDSDGVVEAWCMIADYVERQS